MNRHRRQRLLLIGFALLILSIGLGFVLFALKQNINLFYTPSQLVQGEVPLDRTVRLGGLVPKGSVHHAEKSLQVTFAVTDLTKTVTVIYEGILPDLFREGQGVVVQGQWTAKNIFIANEVLAKHDEKYMPPQVAASLGAQS